MADRAGAWQLRHVQNGTHMSFWDVFWLIVSAFVFISYLMVLFNILGDLFRDRELKGGWKAVWVICLLILPLLTALVYLIARGAGMAKRATQAAKDADDAMRSYIRSASGGGTSPAEQIATAKQLLEAGTITQSEFDSLKAKALA